MDTLVCAYIVVCIICAETLTKDCKHTRPACYRPLFENGFPVRLHFHSAQNCGVKNDSLPLLPSLHPLISCFTCVLPSFIICFQHVRLAFASILVSVFPIVHTRPNQVFCNIFIIAYWVGGMKCQYALKNDRFEEDVDEVVIGRQVSAKKDNYFKGSKVVTRNDVSHWYRFFLLLTDLFKLVQFAICGYLSLCRFISSNTSREIWRYHVVSGLRWNWIRFLLRNFERQFGICHEIGEQVSLDYLLDAGGQRVVLCMALYGLLVAYQ